MPKIKTFLAACKELKLDPKKVVPNTTAFPKPHQKALIAIAKLMIVIQALNGDWVPDWNDSEQNKYYGWWDMEKDKNNPSGFRLADVYYFLCSTSGVGSRLCFKSSEIAEWALKQKEIVQLYKDFMTI